MKLINIDLPFPRSSSSSWTTKALPMTALGPLSGICTFHAMGKLTNWKMEKINRKEKKRKKQYPVEKKIIALYGP